jgi:hypothetical protein
LGHRNKYLDISVYVTVCVDSMEYLNVVNTWKKNTEYLRTIGMWDQSALDQWSNGNELHSTLALSEQQSAVYFNMLMGTVHGIL